MLGFVTVIVSGQLLYWDVAYMPYSSLDEPYGLIIIVFKIYH